MPPARPARPKRSPAPHPSAKGIEQRAQHLREVIEEEIATGALLPGVRLDEQELAQRFGVSRTPVREALRMLVGEGLLENRPHRGSVVVRLTPGRLVEMFEVMAEFEAMCARLAARRMSDAEFASLEAAHAACRAAAGASDTDAYFYAHEAFHFAIYAGSHNEFLAEQAAALQRKLRPYRRLQLRVRGRVRRSFEEHDAIVDALHDGDADRAAEAVRGHVVVQGERFADLVSSMSRLDVEPADDVRSKPRVPHVRSVAAR